MGFPVDDHQISIQGSGGNKTESDIASTSESLQLLRYDCGMVDSWTVVDERNVDFAILDRQKLRVVRTTNHLELSTFRKIQNNTFFFSFASFKCSDLVVSLESRYSNSCRHSELSHTFGVRNSEVLPGHVFLAVQRLLQYPSSGTGRNCHFQNHIGHLVLLSQVDRNVDLLVVQTVC